MMYTHETPYMYAYGYGTTSSSSSTTQIMSMSHQVAAAEGEGEGDHHIHTHGDSNHLHNEQLEWMSHSCSSPSSISYGSPTYPITRSLSTHSLLSSNNNNNALLHHPYPHLSPFISSTTAAAAAAAATPNDYLDLMIMDTTSVRRVLSTGDLHRMKKGWEYGGGLGRSTRTESEVSSESNAIIQGMNRASPYSPQEKKQRIERYRSKRNHRNFTKKIKYACRKTLADSRPRIRGRFARNDEIGKNSQLLQWNQIEEEEDDDDDDVDDNWINYLDSVSPNMFT